MLNTIDIPVTTGGANSFARLAPQKTMPPLVSRSPLDGSDFNSRTPAYGENAEADPMYRSHENEGANVFPVEQRPPVVEPVEAAPLAQDNEPRLSGVVLEMATATVLSEVTVGGHVVQISLPPAVFPDGFRAGSPFYLQLVSVRGIRTPQISPRVPNPSADLEKIHAEIDGLMDGF
jgi:hypothetical protein